MKIKLTLLLLFCTFLMTGCIDIFQSVSLDKGQVKMTMKFTIQKAILEMGASFSGEETDYEDLLNEGIDIFDQFEEINGTISSIDTEYEIGAALNIAGSMKDMARSLDNEIEYIPVYKNHMYEIRIPGMGKADEETDEFGAAFLSGAKYRLLLDLSGDLRKYPYPKIRFEDSNMELTNQISSNRYGSSLLIEIPLILLMFTEESLIIELHPSN
ncbi:hypothetical protein EXM22_02320 [Oceanispirochaeta crateris]|uniref:Uncharacterized protein n=1 Tax=Oceanispirochaeta crateris TaxID=2518645 RepID=A0A5C1QJV8_9SPIO|nr:hypothetical protein [Oceanispirochaeta crateris]QEN06884.1 hypothetical protein EXM22_02320 [Oceanispirochaeta crateris]